MSDSIRELIMKNRLAALQAITVANGFDNNILSTSVQREMQNGQDFTVVPMLLLLEGDESKDAESASYPFVMKRLMVTVAALMRIDDATDTRSADEVLNVLRSDVERAWMADTSCGGYAINTGFEGSGPLDLIDGMPETGTGIMFWIQYRHIFNNPKSQV